MVVVVNYGLGNLGSLLNMLKKIGAEAVVSSDPEVINRDGDRFFDVLGYWVMRHLPTELLEEALLEEATA